MLCRSVDISVQLRAKKYCSKKSRVAVRVSETLQTVLQRFSFLVYFLVYLRGVPCAGCVVALVR